MTTLSKTDVTTSKAIQDKVNVAVTQAILQVLGPDHVVKIISGNYEMAQLLPAGQNLSIRLSVDIYDKTT